MYKPELLSPVGDFECLKAAVQNGADSVYLGASTFSARAKAKNFDLEELKEAITYAKVRSVKVHLTLNTLIKNEEFKDAVDLAIKAYNLGVDAIIIQDLGLADFLHKNYPEIPIHCSTQMTVHNLEGTKMLLEHGYSRVVLSRELTINEIKNIKDNINGEIEVFAHGALCISYSGGCLLSSMIGGRSGNRGLCAQPCRLPYELIDKTNNKTLDSGYLLSPKDLCSIEYLPYLIKAKVDSFKIEGRMKTPLYVGTITRIYRKYIDYIIDNIEKSEEELVKEIRIKLNTKNENTNLTDLEELKQVFNRGSFSLGHLDNNENRELIFKEKPNNMGIYLGQIKNFNKNKGHISFYTKHPINIGDKISIDDEIYNISELMINNKNFKEVPEDSFVTIGRMQGKIHPDQKIYKLENSKLTKEIKPTFSEDKNFKKVNLDLYLEIKKDKPILAKIKSNNCFYDKLNFEYISDIIPEEAINNSITKETILEKINKTGNSEYNFNNIEINLDDNLFINISKINELRRAILDTLEKQLMAENTYNLIFKEELFNDLNKTSQNGFLDTKVNNNISLLLNKLNPEFDYSNLNLDIINKLYIPLRFFINNKYSNLLKTISNKTNLYIYFPHIIRDNKLNIIENNLDNIINDYNIKGFIISNISQVNLIKKYNLDIIGNYTLNTYNIYSIDYLKSLDINKQTISPELAIDEINSLKINNTIPQELIVYGKTPVMTNNYCYLGTSNKCYKDCKRLCEQNNIYVLKDRFGYDFEIIPDNIFNLTTIYNSKITSINYDNIDIDSIRIDIIDEDINEINNIMNSVKNNSKLTGKDYTNGKTAERT